VIPRKPVFHSETGQFREFLGMVFRVGSKPIVSTLPPEGGTTAPQAGVGLGACGFHAAARLASLDLPILAVPFRGSPHGSCG